MNVAAAIANVLIASPSRPSVRLTAFDQDDEGEHDERQVPPAQVGDQPLEEGEDQARVVGALLLQHHQHAADDECHENLPTHLVAWAQAMVILPNDLQVVVREADAAERRRRQHGDPDVDVRQVGPEQGGHERRGENQQAAHGRRARFRTMTLRSLLTDHLPDLELAQTPDHPGSEEETDGQRRQARRRRAKRDVPGDVQDTKRGVQRVEQEVEHRLYRTPCRLRRRDRAVRATSTSSKGSVWPPML